MTASFNGHVHIVRTLIKAKAQINTQDKVWLLLPLENMYHHTQCYGAVLDL